VAERKQRGDKAGDERRADATASHGEDEVVDEEAQSDESVADELDDDDLDEDALAADDETDGESAKSAGKAAKGKGGSTGPANRKSEKPKTVKVKSDRPGIFARFVNFVREVVAELRKVIWPTRSELLTYTTVVVLFVTMMFTIVGTLDYGFAKGVLWVFGNKTSDAE
jgi:preprotein translocase subunit SecE